MTFAVASKESDLRARWQGADGYWGAREAPRLEKENAMRCQKSDRVARHVRFPG